MTTDFDMRIPKIMTFAEKYYPAKKFKHALRVACYAADAAREHTCVDPVKAFITGLAHDLIEDTDCPQDEFKKIVGSQIFTTVLTLTKSDDEEYQDYIHRVLDSKDSLAILVKRADMKDHMAQLDTLTDKLRDKYLPVLHLFL